MKLKEQSDQGETSRLVSTLYGRFHRIRCNILKLINELGLRSREPLAAKVETMNFKYLMQLKFQANC